MLVLSRHRNESIMIGEGIEVCIVDIRGDKVRLGIEAPQDVPVHRHEVYDAIKRKAIAEAAVNQSVAAQQAASAISTAAASLTDEQLASIETPAEPLA